MAAMSQLQNQRGSGDVDAQQRANGPGVLLGTCLTDVHLQMQMLQEDRNRP